MHDKKVLMIVNSVYQLFTAIHLKQVFLKNSCVDLVVTDITRQLKETVPRLEETGLFSRVIFGAMTDLNRKYAAATESALTEAFRNGDRIFCWVLNDDLAEYEAVYFANFDLFVRMLACKIDEKSCPFIWYEDGFSSYVIDYLREDRAAINRHPEGGKIRNKVAYTLLYAPHLAIRGDHLPNHPIPKICTEDDEFRQLLNFVFDYHPAQQIPPFLFLEQSFRAEGIQTNDLKLMKECKQSIRPGDFLIKPHPRNPFNIPQEQGLTRRYSDTAPWELFLLNEDLRHTAVITVCSNAALTSRLLFGKDIHTVMLYKLFEGKVLWKEDAVLKRYLKNFYRQYGAQNYYVPRTVYELRNILAYLGELLGGTDERME